MTNSNNAKMKQAINACLANAERLLWGSNTAFPSYEDIGRANALISTAIRLDHLISGGQEKAEEK